MTVRNMEKRLQAIEGTAGEFGGDSLTWEERRERARRVHETLTKLFAPGGNAKPFDERTPEYWQSAVEWEGTLGEELQGIPPVEHFGAIVCAVNEHERGTICHGENEKDVERQGENGTDTEKKENHPGS